MKFKIGDRVTFQVGMHADGRLGFPRWDGRGQHLGARGPGVLHEMRNLEYIRWIYVEGVVVKIGDEMIETFHNTNPGVIWPDVRCGGVRWPWSSLIEWSGPIPEGYIELLEADDETHSDFEWE